MIGTIIASALGWIGTAATRLIPDVNKKQDHDQEIRVGNQEINKTLAGHASVWVAMSIALTRYMISFIVGYIIIAAFFRAFGIDLPVPQELQDAFKLLIPMLV